MYSVIAHKEGTNWLGLHITYITLLFRVKLFQSFEKTGQDKGRWDSTQSI